MLVLARRRCNEACADDYEKRDAYKRGELRELLSYNHLRLERFYKVSSDHV